jgi:hypothetical protein
VVETYPWRGIRSTAAIRYNQRIGAIELDLHGVVDEAVNHRNGVKNGRAQIEADKDHERVDEKAPDLMVFS